VRFDPATLRLLDERQEVDIETFRPDGSPRRTTVWPLVDGEDVFVRSWRGERGYWFQSATEPGAQVALIIDERRIPVSVLMASDPESVARCSRQLERKYANSASLPDMLLPIVLPTTIRLEPA